MEPSLRKFVRERAGFRCEYCRIQENELAEIVFHIEHIIAIKHGGGDESNNLALACDRCNLHKGSNLAGIDPESGQMSALFNPRRDDWDQHFEMNDYEIVGKSLLGRATVQVLKFNSPRRLLLRQLLTPRQ
jgi:hypothetical protein